MPLCLLAFVLTPPAKAFPGENFCHDAASWSEWEKLKRTRPMMWQMLASPCVFQLAYNLDVYFFKWKLKV
ncbi:MAG: hypothetical protein A2520_00805 [Deltaproteobacteria bacterium RIFOXYD12_FULL_53_23]|nr:MAG: hypothetical protein A2520_00805 [Deltaproteobacteria bacterium RIFOXYD12_FULL_53_23]